MRSRSSSDRHLLKESSRVPEPTGHSVPRATGTVKALCNMETRRICLQPAEVLFFSLLCLLDVKNGQQSYYITNYLFIKLLTLQKLFVNPHQMYQKGKIQLARLNRRHLKIITIGSNFFSIILSPWCF